MDDAPTQISGPLVIDDEYDDDFDAEEPVSTGDAFDVVAESRAVGPWTWSRENLIWCAGAGALALFLLVMMIVKIAT
jgi:hypothetical protein